jgi:hypothetical protein
MVMERMECRVNRGGGNYCSVACRNVACARGAKKGTKRVVTELKEVEDQRGNPMVRDANHPRARANGYVLGCIKVLEQIGVIVGRQERVEHKNGDRRDNGILNLRVVKKYDGAVVWDGGGDDE